MEKQYTFKKSINDKDETTLEIKVEPARFLKTKEKVFNRLASEVKLPGFRPGKAPKALIEAQISSKVYDESLNELVPDITASILDQENIIPLNQVRYEFIKMSDADGLEFKAFLVVMPEFELNDPSKIKIKKEVKEVSDSDVANEIVKIVQYYKSSKNKDNKEDKKEEDKKIESKDITDEYIKSINIGFNDLKSLQDEVRKQLSSRSLKDSEVAWLNSVVKEAVKQSKIKVPKILIEQSVDLKQKDYEKKLTELNLKLDEFLKVQKTTIEKLRDDWYKDTEERFAEELLLLKIIKKENIKVEDSEIQNEINKITDEKSKAEIDTLEGRRYLVTVLLQQKAITWLKQQVEK